MGATPTRAEIFQVIRRQLAEILEIDESRIEESSSFVDDLDADSLALIELVEAIEAEYSKGDHQFRIEDEDLEDLRTMRDAVDYVASVLGATD
jgi:acyl carrier protein